MGAYLDMTWADLRALTRVRRAEARARLPVVRFSVCESIEFSGGEAISCTVAGMVRRKRQAKAWRLRQWASGVRTCAYCLREVTLARNKLNSATTDHRHPLALGGADDASNWAVACLECNRAKADMTEAEFRALRGFAVVRLL